MAQVLAHTPIPQKQFLVHQELPSCQKMKDIKQLMAIEENWKDYD